MGCASSRQQGGREGADWRAQTYRKPAGARWAENQPYNYAKCAREAATCWCLEILSSQRGQI